jgi:hypothetical protein
MASKTPRTKLGTGHYSRDHIVFTDTTKRHDDGRKRAAAPPVPRKQAAPIDPDNSYSGPGMSAPLSKGRGR